MRALAVLLAALLTPVAPAQDTTPPWNQKGGVEPAWARVAGRKTETIVRKKGESETDAGARLSRKLHALQAGETLKIGPGRWSIENKTSLELEGRADAPIWIVALDPKRRPVITRPNGKQNVLNVGDRGPCRYLALRQLEFTGGSSLIRLYDCVEVWIDRCELHHGGNVGITANSHDAERVYITRNHLHHFSGGTAEGMYLGANDGKHVLRYSVVAYNHVHHCSGKQGDGIELKQGSYGNWIVGNHVHDCSYPCITVYGTAGKPINRIERNLCYRSGDNGIQVQGEALVRANVVVSAKGSAFASTDHQGKTVNLRVIGNTFVNSGIAVKLTSWNGRKGMLFTNNACYSEKGRAVHCPSGSDQVRFESNVAVGRIEGARGKGFAKGKGLKDFAALNWKASKQPDARPTRGSALLGKGQPQLDADWKTALDLAGTKRRARVAGALEPGARSAVPAEPTRKKRR